VFNAGGGIDQFLAEHAVIAMADHSQAPVQSTISLQRELADLGVLAPKGGVQGGEGVDVAEPQIAVCPSQRAAMVYALNEAERDAMRASVVTRALALDGVDLVIWLERDAHDAPREAVIASPNRGELRFAPSGSATIPNGPPVPNGSAIDARGRAWSVEGELAVLRARIEDGRLIASEYPDALARVWSSLICPTSGEVLLSAAPGYEFLDWGGAAHVGGGSHGSLHASDSLGALVLCGVAPAEEPAQWAIRDIAPMVRRHFGLASV
jgi:hypothetical protein